MQEREKKASKQKKKKKNENKIIAASNKMMAQHENMKRISSKNSFSGRLCLSCHGQIEDYWFYDCYS